MKVINKPEDGKNFVEYSTRGTKISFNDGEISADLQKKERDDDVKIDVCMDYMGGLTFGTSGAKVYVAQIFIPARQYKEVVDDDYIIPYGDGSEGDGTVDGQEHTKLEPVPFSMDNVELTLFEQEV